MLAHFFVYMEWIAMRGCVSWRRGAECPLSVVRNLISTAVYREGACYINWRDISLSQQLPPRILSFSRRTHSSSHSHTEHHVPEPTPADTCRVDLWPTR